MESLNQKSSQVFCAVRKQWVSAQPEELVRQRLLLHLIRTLKFPESLILLESTLSQMPHFVPGSLKIPERRADIVCFAKNIHPDHSLYPLLLIECKAVKLGPKVINQVVGYNHFVQAHFIAIANQEETKTGWYDPQKKDYVFREGIPSFDRLVESVSV